MKMDEGLDTGPMLLRRELDIRGKNAGQVTEEIARLGAGALVEWLANPTPSVPQPADDATYASKVDKAEARIEWTRPGEDIERQVRAFSPAPGAWFEVSGERIKLLAAEVIPLPRHPGESGNDGRVVDDQLLIACGEDALRPILVQRAGRSPMPAEDFLRGFPIPEGTILP
jgi:methionyl-tRNA formyltransferase